MNKTTIAVLHSSVPVSHSPDIHKTFFRNFGQFLDFFIQYTKPSWLARYGPVFFGRQTCALVHRFPAAEKIIPAEAGKSARHNSVV